MMTAATIIEAAHNKDAAMPIGGIKHTRIKMRAARGDAMYSSAASLRITKVSIALIQNANIPIIIINTVVMLFCF